MLLTISSYMCGQSEPNRSTLLVGGGGGWLPKFIFRTNWSNDKLGPRGMVLHIGNYSAWFGEDRNVDKNLIIPCEPANNEITNYLFIIRKFDSFLMCVIITREKYWELFRHKIVTLCEKNLV